MQFHSSEAVWFVKQYVVMGSMLSNTSYLFFFLTQNWKLNIAMIKIVAKKKYPTKAKTLLPKISKEHGIRFRNNHNYEMLIIQKSVLLLNWFGCSIIDCICYHCSTMRNPSYNCWSFAANKKGTEFLTAWGFHKLPHKN